MNIDAWIKQNAIPYPGFGGWMVTDLALRLLLNGKVLVPVELLKRMLPGGGLWNLEELRAIIDKDQS